MVVHGKKNFVRNRTVAGNETTRSPSVCSKVTKLHRLWALPWGPTVYGRERAWKNSGPPSAVAEWPLRNFLRSTRSQSVCSDVTKLHRLWALPWGPTVYVRERAWKNSTGTKRARRPPGKTGDRDKPRVPLSLVVDNDPL